MNAPTREVGEPADALERRLRFILRAGDFPALSKLFTEAMAISVDNATSSQAGSPDRRMSTLPLT